jgi:hypothetical protein
MGIEAFGIDLASRFATEHPGLRVKFKAPSEKPRSGGAFLYISGGVLDVALIALPLVR